ncbi:MAG: alpha-amylase [Thermotogae bacterium]|nr:alpha-amylase [Thermotogota bacterium]MCP5465925.1 alpha-amylase [Thermotogota bacterium]
MALNSPAWLKSSVIYEIFVRNHSNAGTLNEVLNDLNRIKNLGVDILWFMPFYPIGKKNRKGNFGSPYAISDYTEIFSDFGSTDQFREIVERAHELGMKIMIDIVFNHTAYDSDLYRKNPDYFIKDKNGNPTRKIDDWSDVIDFNFENKEVWNELKSVLKYWVSIGVDGFRCDVAPLVPIQFWKESKEMFEDEVIWLAESVHKSFISHVRKLGYKAYSDPEVQQVFDITYDYDGFEYLQKYFSGKAEIKDYVNHLFVQETLYPENSIKMRFLENHDNPRAAAVITGKQRLKNWSLFYNIIPGASLVYAGQELALDTYPDLFEKNSIRWEKGDYDFYNFFKKVLNISKQIKSECDSFSIDEICKGFYAVKWTGENNYIAFINLEDRFGKFDCELNGIYKDMISGADIKLGKNCDIPKTPFIFMLK